MSRFYAAILSDPPKKATVGRLAQLTIEMEMNRTKGILPVAGGWQDQDPDHIFLIRLASSVRADRQHVEDRKSKRKSSTKRS